MENQPRFNLNDALLRWRHELVEQPGMAAEDVRELETHLVESLSGFKRNGMSEAAAFAQARERLGSAVQIAAEFAKAHWLRIWRDRIFWIALLTFALALSSSVITHPVMEMARRLRSQVGTWTATLAFAALTGCPGLLLSAVMLTGHAELIYRKCSWLFQKRWRLAAAGVLGVIVSNLLTYRFTGVLVIFELGFLGFAVIVIPCEMRAASIMKPELNDLSRARAAWRDRLFWLLLANLGISAWTMIVWGCADGYILHLPEAQRGHLPIIVSSLFFLTWLGPMGVVGLGLWAGRLLVISRMMNTRGQAALIAGALAAVGIAVRFWLSTWNVSSRNFSPADWKFAFVVDTVATLAFGVLSLALIVWLTPSQQRQNVSSMSK